MVFLKKNDKKIIIKYMQIEPVDDDKYFYRRIYDPDAQEHKQFRYVSFPAFKEITYIDVKKYENDNEKSYDYFYHIAKKKIKFAEDFDINKINPENNKYLLFLHGYYYLLKENDEFSHEYFKKSAKSGYFNEIYSFIKDNKKFIKFLLEK
jgi:hypothetical protein